MFELVLRAPEALVEPVSDLLMDELDALSVSVEDADADTAAEHALFGEPGLPAPAAGWERSTLKALFDDAAGAERAATLSVSVEDADADTAAEHALFGEPGMPAPAAGWERSTLKALFDDAADAERAATLLLAQDWGGELHVQSMAAVAEQDWVRLTQSQFAPVEITPEFWVVPSWHEAPAQARQVIRLDPGLAFGTGTHPSTRMCLRWLARRPAGTRPARVLDYGCGSGILAIAAALMGAQQVDAVDIDPAAVKATHDNARHNGVALSPGLPTLAQGPYDVVLANILATPLKLLAPLLTSHLAPGGWLVLSGILARQAEDISAAYASGLTLSVADQEEGWILMSGQLSPA